MNAIDKTVLWAAGPASRKRKRPVGCRQTTDGKCVVRYLDTMEPSFNLDGSPNAHVVLYHGHTWEWVWTMVQTWETDAQ